MGETKEKSQIIDFLGGFFGGVASTYIGHPLDTVKVRMQVSQISSVLLYSNAHQNLSPTPDRLIWFTKRNFRHSQKLIQFTPAHFIVSKRSIDKKKFAVCTRV